MNEIVAAAMNSTALQAVKPPTIIVMGVPGSGKTFSIVTLLQAGLEVFCVFTESNGLDTILDACAKMKVPTDKLHWMLVAPAPPGLDTLAMMASTISQKGFEAIQNIKEGVDKAHTQQFLKLVGSLKNFVDDKDGKSYGSVLHFGPDKALVIDSLSGVNTMAMDQTIGFKPAAHMGEWGVAMNLEEKFILTMTSNLKCYFILIAHIDREPDEIQGITIQTLAALGRKNAPKIAKLFSEIVLAKKVTDKNNTTFLWSTSEPNTDLKNRALAIASNLPPSFVPIVAAHERRVKAAAEGVAPSPTA